MRAPNSKGGDVADRSGAGQARKHRIIGRKAMEPHSCGCNRGAITSERGGSIRSWQVALSKPATERPNRPGRATRPSKARQTDRAARPRGGTFPTFFMDAEKAMAWLQGTLRSTRTPLSSLPRQQVTRQQCRVWWRDGGSSPLFLGAFLRPLIVIRRWINLVADQFANSKQPN